ncbi:Holliday junction resolvase RuvX [Nocardioides yefusunii]|uniref:Putative pre-16S rRNA nuclease n=1 Tax=Nocardioides yefusunii TaxID=2500546 RepID=A0ABW1R0T6_9ACTN|nr:Holliday junction resolvase RuvX [Nocardioides yefusunii]
MRFGVRVGVDPGDARVGVARSDPSGVLATPVETVRRGKGDVRQVAKIIAAEEAVEVVVGLPRNLKGKQTPSTTKALEFAEALARRIAPVPVRMVDERLTTVTAESMLRDQGRKGQKRRAVVDQVAAVVILQHALDSERTSGRPPGDVLVVTPAAPDEASAGPDASAPGSVTPDQV